MVKVRRSGKFVTMLGNLLSKDERYRLLVDKAVDLFVRNPKDTRLGTHALSKRMRGQWAFWVTDDVRVVFEWLSKTTVRFLMIGGHPEVYRRKRTVR